MKYRTLFTKCFNAMNRALNLSLKMNFVPSFCMTFMSSIKMRSPLKWNSFVPKISKIDKKFILCRLWMCVSLKLFHECKTYCNRNCKEASNITHKKLILGDKIYFWDYIMLLRKCTLVDIWNFKCLFFANLIFCFSVYFLRIIFDY